MWARLVLTADCFSLQDDERDALRRHLHELHSQYVIGFSPDTLDGKVRKLEVRVKKAGMNARARKTYIRRWRERISRTAPIRLS